MIPQKQLTLADFFEHYKEIFVSDKPQFLSLLENHIDLDSIIPASFYSRYHVFLNYSRHLREFCGFTKVPDASKITRFKQDFLPYLEMVFENLVDLTEPICQAVNSAKADMTVFDSSGIEEFVTENNPKYANRIIKQLKAYSKAMRFDNNYDPYKAAYASMPYCAAANSDVRQLYVDGHFCYAYKIGIVTNDLGIARHLNLYNRDFLNAHPELIPNRKSMFVRPKMIWDYDPATQRAHRKCTCENPCTSSKCGRMIYVYPEQDLRAYPGTLRGTEEWDTTYKIRTTVERSINHFKDSFCLSGRKNRNEKTLHADLILAGITQLITVVLADRIHQHQYIRSLKPLIA